MKISFTETLLFNRSAETWPQKLLMQLMPKALIGSIGGSYLKNSKSVFFVPQNCEALENLVQVMSNGYVSLFLKKIWEVLLY